MQTSHKFYASWARLCCSSAVPSDKKARPLTNLKRLAPGEPVSVNTGIGAMYFHSGRAEGAGLLFEKSAPAQVLADRPFTFTYKASNMTGATLENVTVMDRASGNCTATESDPKAASIGGGMAVWNLGSLGPKDSPTVTANGSSPDEGVVTTLGLAFEVQSSY